MLEARTSFSSLEVTGRLTEVRPVDLLDVEESGLDVRDEALEKNLVVLSVWIYGLSCGDFILVCVVDS